MASDLTFKRLQSESGNAVIYTIIKVAKELVRSAYLFGVTRNQLQSIFQQALDTTRRPYGTRPPLTVCYLKK